MRNDVLESIFFCVWSLCCCVRELVYGIEEMNVFIELACLVARIHTDQKNSKKKKKVSFPNILFYYICIRKTVKFYFYLFATSKKVIGWYNKTPFESLYVRAYLLNSQNKKGN